MDITPTPELRAACRIVLGVGGLAAVIGAMRGDTYRWAQAASISCIVPASRSLTVDYTIDAATLEFAGRAPAPLSPTRRPWMRPIRASRSSLRAGPRGPSCCKGGRGRSGGWCSDG